MIDTKLSKKTKYIDLNKLFHVNVLNQIMRI